MYGGGGTYIGNALSHVLKKVLVPSAGDRENVRNIVIILTDGASSDQFKSEADAIRATVSF